MHIKVSESEIICFNRRLAAINKYHGQLRDQCYFFYSIIEDKYYKYEELIELS